MLLAGICLWLLALFITETKTSKPLPEFLHPCRRTDPNINECITKAITDLRPQLKEGIPEHKIPSLEPLFIEELVAAKNLGMNVIIRDLNVYGCSNFTIHRMEADIPSGRFNFEVGFDHLLIKGKYKIDGRLLMVPIKGEGYIESDVYNTRGNCSLKLELYKNGSDDNDYVRFTELDINIAIQDGKLHLDSQFGGQRLLGHALNMAINLNFPQFVNDFKPLIEDTLESFMIETGNHIIEGYTYATIFPN